MYKPFFAVILSILISACSSAQDAPWKTVADPLKEMDKLRDLIKAPQFKNIDFKITTYGAVSGGKTNNTEAFKKAIDACAANGGGHVVVSAGVWLTGAIRLKNNVNLTVAEGATILFSRDAREYPIVFTYWEGAECMNYSALIYANGATNIAITGKGTLDGNADIQHWWNWVFGKDVAPIQRSSRNRLIELMKQKVDPEKRTMGEGAYLRPNMVQFINCKNILISGVKMVNSPMWIMNPVLSENITIENVSVVSHGPNNDGCDRNRVKTY